MTENWRKQSLCHTLQQTDPEMWARFFADSALERRPARNICAECPVRRECLQTALESKNIWGVWGGCDESELRRALWVDANGDPMERCRYPHCPFCKARPGRLFVVGVCELMTGRKRERVECSACNFSWRSPSSVSAVKAYWREKAQSTRVRAKVPGGRIPSTRPLRVLPGLPPSVPSEAVPSALAASGWPVQSSR
jgi:hypothetical protein